MDRATAQAISLMADSVFTWLESNCQAYNVGFEYLPSGESALMLQSQTTEPIVKEYKSGRRVYRYSFALLLRLPNNDTAARIDNQKELQAIADAIAESGLSPDGFTIRDIQQETTARVMATDESFDVAMLSMHVDYEKGA